MVQMDNDLKQSVKAAKDFLQSKEVEFSAMAKSIA